MITTMTTMWKMIWWELVCTSFKLVFDSSIFSDKDLRQQHMKKHSYYTVVRVGLIWLQIPMVRLSDLLFYFFPLHYTTLPELVSRFSERCSTLALICAWWLSSSQFALVLNASPAWNALLKMHTIHEHRTLFCHNTAGTYSRLHRTSRPTLDPQHFAQTPPNSSLVKVSRPPTLEPKTL